LKKTINIVIVTYNNKDLLEKCISTVFQSLGNTEIEGIVTVVDNDSSDGTEKLIRERFSSVHYLLNKKNLGTAKSFNRGIKENIDAHYTLLLNDDVELFPNTISLMIETLNKFQNAQGIPARLIYPDGRPQRIKLKILGMENIRNQNIRYVQFAGTTACMYYTEIFRELGLFDEFYFFYNEDLDFSLRAKRNGLKFIFNPEIKVIHYKYQGKAKGIKEVKPHFYAANYYFYKKNYGRILSCVCLIMAFIHITVWKKRFKKENNNEKLLLLEKGREKLKHTVKNYKELVKKSKVLCS